MDRLDDLAYTGISRYFKALSVFGYKSQGETGRLMVLLFIEDILRGPMGMYVTEDDYKTIVNVLYCLFGSTCLIPYPEFASDTSVVHRLNSSDTRLSENDMFRYAEDELLRLVNE